MVEKNNGIIYMKQDSPLGSLGMSALAEKFCGPAYDLSDLLVGFFKIGDSVNVSFYDMDVYIKPIDRLYPSISRELAREEVSRRGVQGG
jgi:hypothetical protein